MVFRPGRTRARLRSLPANFRGALWVLMAAMIFTIMGTLVKFLGNHFDSFEIAFFRALFGLGALMPFLLKLGIGQIRTKRLGLHLTRGFIGSLGMLCGFYALTHLSYADAISISYARSLFLIPLAVVFLKEVVGRRRWTATLVGFIGVLVMMRPGSEFELAMVVAIAGAFFVALVTILIKKLSQTEKPEVILFYFGIVSTSVSFVPAMMVWRTPTLWEFVLLMAVGAIAASGQYCMIRGYKVGETTAITPFDYTRLLFASVIGIFVFAEPLEAWTILGAMIIATSTLYIAYREAGLGKKVTPTEPAVNPPMMPDK
jgi:drug/metabolite transporter (DMT)-like permease